MLSNMCTPSKDASLMLQSVAREDMSTQKKHWMVTLQEVFYPALAAVGIPCKYADDWLISYQSYSHDAVNFMGKL